jgi:oxalate oxidoreductase subunit delta
VLGAIATVDAEGISGVCTVDFSGSEGGVDSAGTCAGIAAPVVGAMARLTGMAKKEVLARIVKNVAGMERGYNEVKMQKLHKFRTTSVWGG